MKFWKKSVKYNVIISLLSVIEDPLFQTNQSVAEIPVHYCRLLIHFGK